MTKVPPSFTSKIFSAARNGHEDILTRYITSGGDLNITDHDGWTLLMHAVVHRQGGIVKILLDAKADLTVRDEDGTTAQSIAQERGFTEIAAMLQQAGASG